MVTDLVRYLAENILINGKILFPRFSDLSYDVRYIAWRSHYGGRFEILKRGFIGKAYIYDINSAYPFAPANILVISKMVWHLAIFSDGMELYSCVVF